MVCERDVSSPNGTGPPLGTILSSNGSIKRGRESSLIFFIWRLGASLLRPNLLIFLKKPFISIPPSYDYSKFAKIGIYSGS
jgi:hypothetical protein